MHREDEERLRREADIAAAVRGPDYSQVENSIPRNRAKVRELLNLQRETDAKQRIPVNNEGSSEDVSRRQSTTREHEQRKRHAAMEQFLRSMSRKLVFTQPTSSHAQTISVEGQHLSASGATQN